MQDLSCVQSIYWLPYKYIGLNTDVAVTQVCSCPFSGRRMWHIWQDKAATLQAHPLNAEGCQATTKSYFANPYGIILPCFNFKFNEPNKLN